MDPEHARNPAAEDAALLHAARAQDPQALETLLDRHLQSVRLFVALHLPIPRLADRVASETFVFAFRNLHSLPDGNALRPWLRAIARQLIAAALAETARSETAPRSAEDFCIVAAREHPDAHSSAGSERLQSCVEELPEASRLLLDRHYRQQESGETIAATTRRSREGIDFALFRTRAHLAQCIAQKPGPS